MIASRRGVAAGRKPLVPRPAATRSIPRLTPRISLRPSQSPHTPSRQDVLKLWEEWDWFACTYCDAAFNETVVCELDHVHPLANGGVDEMWNLAPACATCNRAKGAQEVGLWLA
ncbi:hypothetical protein HEK616_40500 [Streptomyces nigrescens]|uniref:HNH nuclease domain-containing protein n=1 Tax=Streptomyces nigrescens TaxID=1920 RepID=A0ABM7ZW47_STRNI|nr:hypothetical protein HEK616_40500 [Streptomyces nigrescens]